MPPSAAALRFFFAAFATMAFVFTDELRPARQWLLGHFSHQHAGPLFKITADRGYDPKIEGVSPQKINAWHTCKSCAETYVVERYETVDEFESRQAKP